MLSESGLSMVPTQRDTPVMSTRQKLVWVAALYFAEGFPFGMVMDAIPVYLRLQGVSLVDIGLLGLVGLPWTLKFLLAPAVDVWGHRRKWVWVCQALMGLISMISSRAPLADATTSATQPRPPRSAADAIRAPLEQFFARPGFLAVAAFVLTFKLGDMAIGPMIKPFWVDRQFTPVQIGLVPGTLGVVATIGGALIGGSLTSRWGIFRALWVLGIFQAVSNLVYAAAAALPPNAALMYVASLVG